MRVLGWTPSGSRLSTLSRPRSDSFRSPLLFGRICEERTRGDMLAGGDVALCGPRFILPRCKHFPLITDCLLLYAWAMAVSPDDVDTYLLTERLRGIASMREHNFSL